LSDPLDIVAELLEHGPGEDGLPHPIGELVRVRSAARRALELLDEEPTLAAEAFRRVHAAALRAELLDWAIAAVFDELAWRLDPEDPPADLGPVEQLARRLRRAGFIECPTCRRPLESELTIERVERLRADYLRREAARAGAVA
jgi:hypothetical protein